jgi:protoporphyrinogen oxidase
MTSATIGRNAQNNNQQQNIAIIGAGVAGLSAAHDLQRAGHAVTIYEGAPRIGGLAAGFRDEGWDWELEKFYHHWFESDVDLLTLADELGVRDQLIFPRPKTSMWAKGRAYPFDSPLTMLTFPHVPLLPKLRFGFVGLYLRLAKNWRWMERYTADEWLRRFMGKTAYEELWRPMLIGKFGELYDKVTMAWFWARIFTRTVKLGTYNGGFQKFLDTFADNLRSRGVTICTDAAVQGVRRENGKVIVRVGEHDNVFDAVISTTSPAAMLKLVPQLEQAPYADKLRGLRHMSAVVVVLAIKHKFLTDGTYWLNLPAKGTDKTKNDYPFLILAEHTNYMDSAHFGGDHILYCGDYVQPDHEYMRMSEDALAERFISALPQFNKDFTRDWIRKRWVFRAAYAQPIPFVNHSANIPDLATPIPGVYFASMSQIYPYDRGTNYAVRIGREVAARVIEDAKDAVKTNAK